MLELDQIVVLKNALETGGKRFPAGAVGVVVKVPRDRSFEYVQVRFEGEDQAVVVPIEELQVRD